MCNEHAPVSSLCQFGAGQKHPNSRVPAQIGRVDVENAGSGDGGRRGGPQVADLEQQPHGAVQGDPLVAGQGEDLAREGPTVAPSSQGAIAKGAPRGHVSNDGEGAGPLHPGPTADWLPPTRSLCVPDPAPASAPSRPRTRVRISLSYDPSPGPGILHSLLCSIENHLLSCF